MKRAILSAVLLAVLAACSGSKTKAKDNVAIPNELEKLTATVQIAQTWRTSIKSNSSALGEHLQPTIVGENIYFAGTAGDVRAVSRSTGKAIWSAKSDVELSAGAASDGARVVVGGLNGEVLAFDANDGELLWKAEVTSEVLAAPLVTKDRIVVRSNDGLIHGLNASDGKVAWKVDRDVPLLTLRGGAQPVADDEFAYVPIDSGKVVALKLEDGTIKWEQTVNIANGRNELDRIADIDGAVAYASGDLFLAGFNGTTTNVSAQTGQPVWNYTAGSVAGLTLSNRAVFLTDSNSNVIALDRRSGAELWKQTKLLNRRLSAPGIVGEHILVIDFDGYVHAIDAENGDIVGRTRTSDAVVTPLASDGEAVYAQTIDGTLARFVVQ